MMQPIPLQFVIAMYIVHERMRSSAKPARAAGQAIVTISICRLGTRVNLHILQHHHCNNDFLHVFLHTGTLSLRAV